MRGNFCVRLQSELQFVCYQAVFGSLWQSRFRKHVSNTLTDSAQKQVFCFRILGYDGDTWVELMASMKAVVKIAVLVAALGLSACSSWVYRIDIPQGNFLEQKDVDKLRVAMTKEQVVFVLGNPVAANPFDHDTWHYFYSLKGGRGNNFEKLLVVEFKDDRLVNISGDFEKHADFDKPLDI